MRSIKLSEYRIKIKFDKDNFAAEQNNYLSKLVDVQIVNDLDAEAKNPTKNFKFKKCLFGATSLVQNSDQERQWYKGHGIIFDSPEEWSFDNSTDRNAIDFGVDNNSSSVSENH